jgi:hypothetical protein
VPISDWYPDPEDPDDSGQRSAVGGVARRSATG